VNGDGKADIVGFGIAGVTVALATEGGTLPRPSSRSERSEPRTPAGGWASQDQFPRFVADVNGDGMADIVGFGIAGTTFAFATGDGHFAAPIFALPEYGSSVDAVLASQNTYPRELC